MADRCERFFLFSSESERSDDSSGEPERKYIAPEPAVYAVPAPGVEYIAPAPAVPDSSSPVVGYIAPAPAVQRLSPDFAPVVEDIAPAPAVPDSPSPVVEYIAPATPICRPTPVVEYIAPVPTSTPAVSSPPSPSVQSRQSAHRVSTEVPTVISRHHDEWLHAERVLQASSARQGYLFRQMKRRDTQLAVQLTSLGKACEVARGSPVASLLVPVAMREQGLSSKLLAFETQLEDHEVGLLELERQVAVLEHGENFKQLSDLVNEGKVLECERQLAVVELEGNFKRLSDRVNETKALVGLVDDQIDDTRKALTVELYCTKLSTIDEVEARFGDWSLQHDRLMLQVGHRPQQLENWADEVDGVLHGDDGCG